METFSVVMIRKYIGNYNQNMFTYITSTNIHYMDRSDSIDHEEVDIPLKTDYTGYVSWGEYPHNFAAVLNQEEIFRLLIAKGCNCDLKVRRV